MVHNPKPSTPRGLRRHEARSPEARKHAESVWEKKPKQGKQPKDPGYRGPIKIS